MPARETRPSSTPGTNKGQEREKLSGKSNEPQVVREGREFKTREKTTKKGKGANS